MGTSRSEFTTMQVDRCPLTRLRASDLFLQCKMHYISYVALVHQVGGFTVTKGGDGIRLFGVRASKQLVGDVDRICLAAGTVAGEGFFKGDEGGGTL